MHELHTGTSSQSASNDGSPIGTTRGVPVSPNRSARSDAKTESTKCRDLSPASTSKCSVRIGSVGVLPASSNLLKTGETNETPDSPCFEHKINAIYRPSPPKYFNCPKGPLGTSTPPCLSVSATWSTQLFVLLSYGPNSFPSHSFSQHRWSLRSWARVGSICCISREHSSLVQHVPPISAGDVEVPQPFRMAHANDLT
jgi:hypothetical protein